MVAKLIKDIATRDLFLVCSLILFTSKKEQNPKPRKTGGSNRLLNRCKLFYNKGVTTSRYLFHQMTFSLKQSPGV